MTRLFFCILFVLFASFAKSQIVDSISIKVKLDTLNHQLKVKQEFYVYNHSNKVLFNFYLHAWANAYKGKNTILTKIKLQDRKKDLYFAKDHEKGQITNLLVHGVENHELKNNEFLLLKLDKPLAPKQLLTFSAEYSVKLPHEKFTKYGYYDNGDYVLKYFFLKPAPMENDAWILENYKDFEAVAALPTNYHVSLDLPKDYYIYSDLQQEGESWIGKEQNHFRFLFTQKAKTKIDFYDDKKTQLLLGYDIQQHKKENLTRLAKEQITFLEEKLGPNPNQTIFVSHKTKKDQNYFGVDDIDAWFTTLRLFTEEEKQSLKLFQPLSYEYIDLLFSSEKRKDHWIKDGLQVYLQMRYVDQKFPDLKLTGHIADSLKILGSYPLNYFHASKLKMNDRYKLLYLFTARQNFDQAIDTPLDDLSNFNHLAISNFKSGLSFYYLSEYLGEENFNQLIKRFIKQNKGKFITKTNFRNYMILNADKDISWFFDDYLVKHEKINYKLVKAIEKEDSIEIEVRNRTRFKGPFQLVGIKDDHIVAKQWYKSDQKKIKVNFPKGVYDKFVLNPSYLFPEINDRDNYLRTKGFFKNSKKLQFKLYNDIENPEYNQIFLLPQLRWNNYDKLQIGLKFKNSTPLARAFKYSISPKYSTGTMNLTGSGGVGYTVFPYDGWFRSIGVGAGFLYEHYDENLAFRKLSFGVSAGFNKPPRSDRNHGISFNFESLDREVALGQIQTNEDKYSLWNLTYTYTNRRVIHDFEGRFSFQTTEDFQKIYAEAYYRWQAFKNYRIGFRFFGGKFITNDTDTTFFDFGTNFITDYTFSYSLLGRSETEGFLSQQFVLADGGFKSDFDVLVNDWILSTNIEIPVWKMFDVFVDAGIYSNKGLSTQFIYDTGMRVRIVPDFLELFFPIQSTLGFEPSLGNYHERIRFTLNLNLGRVISYLRRGQF